MIVVLVGPHPGAPRIPAATPIGRAALQLGSTGTPVCFSADGEVFHRAVPEGWEAIDPGRVAAIHDRFPSQTRPEAYRRALARMGDPPVGNPESITLLCRDKVDSQRWLQGRLEMPAIETDPAHFADRLRDWGSGFLKPRYGAMGRGISQVVPGQELPARGPGAVPGVEEPLFLQRAVEPPDTGAIAVRALIQRRPDSSWIPLPPVARIAPEGEPIANVSRGAKARPATGHLSEACLSSIARQTREVAAALAELPEGELAVEAGVDFAIDARGLPVLLEVNSRPRGRLEVLAATGERAWHALHVAACARPIRRLWAFSEG